MLVQGGAHFVLDRAFGWVLAVHLTFERMQGLQRRPTHRSRLRPWGPARSPGKCLPASVLKFAPKSRVSLAYLCACRDLFVDGYDAAGQRVYDKVEGKTCHQCRQKTICKHTSCSSCQLLVVRCAERLQNLALLLLCLKAQLFALHLLKAF